MATAWKGTDIAAATAPLAGPRPSSAPTATGTATGGQECDLENGPADAGRHGEARRVQSLHGDTRPPVPAAPPDWPQWLTGLTDRKVVRLGQG